MKSKLLKKRASEQAFTLVETVLAMGIVAFAMLGILGLVPLGLSNFRDAISLTAESQIVQTISNDILLTDYKTVLEKYEDAEPTYYDDEGAPLDSANAPGKLYTVTVELTNVSAPSETGVTASASKCALIQITNIKSPLSPKQYSLVIPKG